MSEVVEASPSGGVCVCCGSSINPGDEIKRVLFQGCDDSYLIILCAMCARDDDSF